MTVFTPEDEAKKIHQAIFQCAASPELLARYQRGYEILFQQIAEKEKRQTTAVIRAIGDLESFEFAARRKRMYPLLTAQFQLVVSLAECEPNLLWRFVNDRDRQIVAWLSLVSAVVKSALKLIKGRVLLAIIQRRFPDAPWSTEGLQ